MIVNVGTLSMCQDALLLGVHKADIQMTILQKCHYGTVFSKRLRCPQHILLLCQSSGFGANASYSDICSFSKV